MSEEPRIFWCCCSDNNNNTNLHNINCIHTVPLPALSFSSPVLLLFVPSRSFLLQDSTSVRKWNLLWCFLFPLFGILPFSNNNKNYNNNWPPEDTALLLRTAAHRHSSLCCWFTFVLFEFLFFQISTRTTTSGLNRHHLCPSELSPTCTMPLVRPCAKSECWKIVSFCLATKSKNGRTGGAVYGLLGSEEETQIESCSTPDATFHLEAQKRTHLSKVSSIYLWICTYLAHWSN